MKPATSWTAPTGINIVLWLSIATGLIGVIVLAVGLAREVVRDLERLQSAASGGLHWTLPQIEVEFLAYQFALEHRDATGAVDLPEVRKRYDILYSRTDTLNRVRLFNDIAAVTPAFDAARDNMNAYLQAALPLIDGTDQVLRAGLPELRKRAAGLRDDLRTIAVSGQAYFAAQSELRRHDAATTLLRLTLTATFLFVALAALSVFLFLLYRQTHGRGIQLAQANERMNTVLSTSLDGIFVFNLEGRVIELNPAAEQIFGLRAEEARGKSIEDLVIPDNLRPLYAAGLKRLRTGGDRQIVGRGRVQMEAMRSNGEIFPIELALQSAHHLDQEIFIAFVRDISKQLADEQELILARDRALAGEEAKARVLTIMSHEIRTPLNGILGNLSLLSRSPLNDSQNQYVHSMEVSGRVLMSHVDAVLDIARFDAGKLELTASAVDLDALVHDLIDGQTGSATERGTRIDWRWCGAPVPWVVSDPARLQQILLNLLGNAVKFTENGRITVELEALPDPCPTPAAMESSSLVSGPCRHIEFRISDTGTGISDADIDRVFEDFHTSDSSFRRNSGGSGLGLGIARRLTHALQGEIGVESILGKGSTFWVRLPLCPAQPPDRDTADLAQDSERPRLDVLVIEDNEINRHLICAMLETAGHEATCAADGRAGVELASARRFDVILMDISMPVMDGLQATRHIRSGNGASARTPILAVSANVLPQEQERFEAAGMDGFIAKPLTVDCLNAALSRLYPDLDPPITGAEALRDHGMSSQAFAGLLTRFREEGDRYVAALPDQPPGTEDLPVFARQTHMLAGSAALFGMQAFQQALAEIETAAKDGDRDGLTGLLPELAPSWQAVRKDLDKTIAAMAAGAS